MPKTGVLFHKAFFGKLMRAVYRIRLATILVVAMVFVLGPTRRGLAIDGERTGPERFFASYCLDCHGPDLQEADLRFDTLDDPSRFTTDDSQSQAWQSIVRVLRSGEMPPESETQPSPTEISQLIESVSESLRKNRPRHGALRRLNRFEYENTVHDLLQIETPLADLLPEDSRVQGFDNVADGLGLSSVLIGRYLEAADVAFENTIRRIKPLPPSTRRIVLMEQKENISSVDKGKGGVISSEGAFVDFTPGWPPARIDPAHPIEDGVYRCRIAVWPHDPSPHRTLAVAVFNGPLFGPGKRKFMGMFDATGNPESPRIIEFTTWMKEGHALHILPWIYPEHVTWRDKEEPRPGVAIAWAETYGPLDQSFPSESQLALFGDTETQSMAEGDSVYIRHRRGVKSHFVASSQPAADAERIIRELLPKAFRRDVDEALANQFVRLTLDRLEQGRTFEQAVRAGVTAVLCSPHFLLLNQQAEVDDFEIASRLSYFLWSSMPDDELLRLARLGKLRDKTVRYQQVERMIDDPKFMRFVDSFTGQWLDLRDLEFTTPDAKLYPEYSELLLRSMRQETRRFFHHLVQEDLSVTNFIDSDFAILNQRLATHYGIEGVRGHEEFRVVDLPESSVRGGVMTHASVLKVTANGTTTSPVVRGAWVLDKLLGHPPPPPPAGVPAIEPDTRGASTIREQLAKHREIESCNRCHKRIDPPGFALEEFDVIGGHRQWYRTLGNKGDRVPKTNYRIGPTIETGGQFSDGRQFDSFTEFRELLSKKPELIAEAVAQKLLIYGCGRPVTIADDHDLQAIVKSASENDFGLRSMIHAVVETELFLSP